MKRYTSYFLLALLLLINASCGNRRASVASDSGKDGGEVEPEQLRPRVDTRFQELFFQAQTEKAKGNYARAYELFEESLKIEGKNAAVHYELAKIDLEVNSNPSAALPHAKFAADSDKTNSWYHFILADCYASLGKYDNAIRSYNEVARLNPDDPTVLYQLAGVQLYAGKIQDAIQTLDELEKESGPFEELSLQKHQLYLQINQPEKAGLELEKLATAYPDEPRYWGMAAQFYSRAGMEEKTLNALEQMKKLDPENGQVHFQLSEYYAAKGRDKESYEELKKAFATFDIPLDQKISVLLRYLTLTDVKPEYRSQAYELLDLTNQLHGEEAKTHSIYGDFLYRDNRKQEALVHYRKASDLDPSRSLIWEQIAIVELEVSDFASMVTDTEKAIQLFPTIPDFYYYNGIANYRLKQYQKAIDALVLGKELVVDNDELLIRFYSTLGEAYHYSGQHVKSDEVYEEALRLDPTNVFILNNYAYYLSLRKHRLDKAAEMSRQSNELSPDVSSFEDTYAWILFQQGKYAEALVWVEKALSNGEVNGELLEHQGDILFKLGRAQEAVLKWKAAAKSGGASDKINQKIDQQNYIE